MQVLNTEQIGIETVFKRLHVEHFKSGGMGKDPTLPDQIRFDSTIILGLPSFNLGKDDSKKYYCTEK